MLTRAHVLAAFWLVFLFLLQSSFFHTPALLIGAVVYFGLREGAGFGWWVGVAAGFLLSLYSTTASSYEILFLGVFGWVSGIVSSKFFRDNRIIQAALWAFSVWIFSSFPNVFFRMF